MTQKTVKLWIHQRCEKYSESDFVFNNKDFPSLKIGDVVDVHERDTQNNHLLLPVTQFHDDFNQKDIVSVEQNVASTFKLTKYNQVIVTKIDPESVALDLVELTFKEQYLSRSDMWRFRKHLLNPMERVVYLNKKIEFCGIRCQVNEMFVRGERVACGVVSDGTRVVFRSQSAMVFIFIQMSLEMWEFDYQGDLYFEKCVNGFLPDLFSLWKIKNCAHYVTIVVFSRWFYDAESLDAFPSDLRSRVLKDYQGRYYQDFYRLIVQNEHYDDWNGPVLFRLKCLLNEYKNSMAKYHETCQMPPARNSTAQEGNFLETINMCATVFARHNIDRDFERTGQQHVIITPGQGVFKVDRNLCNLTKQRVNDIAIGLDLVCLGEQPLHAVPLFIFPSKSNPTSMPDLREDFIIPHWMNFSFFSPIKYPAVQNSFVPRIPIPESVLERISQCKTPIMGPPTQKLTAVVDYDRYDDELFVSRKTSMTRRHVPPTYEEFPEFTMKTRTPSTSSLESLSTSINMSSCKPSVPMKIPTRLEDTQAASLEADHIDEIGAGVGIGRTIVGSADSSPKFQTPTRRRFDNQLEKARKPLVNPFKPGEFSVRITSIRRRWIHVFPVDAAGRAKSAHHFVSGMPVINISPDNEDATKGDLDYNFSAENLTNVAVTGQNTSGAAADQNARLPPINLSSPSNGAAANTSTVGTDGSGKNLVWAWGVTGEEQWNPDMKISTDWKSLTIPSILPITIDFFPDHRSLRNDYVFSEHIILLDDETKELWNGIGCGTFPLNIFNELVSQRLHQGMQLIVLPKELLHSATSALLGAGRDVSRFCQAEAYLCINRIFHRLTLNDNTIFITKFFPRHPYSLGFYTYQYQLQMPDSVFYKPCETKFSHDNLETYKWSVVDNYIAAQGNTDEYTLDRDMKFWESSFLLIPSGHPSIKKIVDKEIRQGDIYAEGFANAETMNHLYLIDGFVKIMETANRIKRNAHVASNRIYRKVSTSIPQIASAKDLKSAGRSASTQSLTDELTTTMPMNILSILKNDKNFFIPKGNRLPELTFVSAEIVHWLMSNVAEINTIEHAIAFCQQQMDEGRIAHITSQTSFIYGFVLYYFVSSDTKFTEIGSFMEVEVTEYPSCSTEFGRNCTMKTENVDLDPMRKSDRREWGQVRFGLSYCPKSVLQLTIQWMVATGAVVGDLVHSWCRKASACGFHLVAVPLDPFSTPSDQNSDPMRRPISILLDEDEMSSVSDEMFSCLAEQILKSFGFLPMSCQLHRKEQQFVHLSGGMFVRIDSHRKGFSWVWNNMLGKRYRTAATGDEEFLDFMLADFRRFASNFEGRLANFISTFKGFQVEHLGVE